MTRNIGIDVKIPKKICDDPNCPFHGKISIRGRILEGTVTSTSMMKTIVVRRNYLRFIKKYNRYEKRHGTVHAHVPECQEPKLGSRVKIAECRPISKTKSFVLIECEDTGEE